MPASRTRACAAVGILHRARAGDRAALPPETSFPGVFAIGDVRAGSAKRVVAEIGEGAAVGLERGRLSHALPELYAAR